MSCTWQDDKKNVTNTSNEQIIVRARDSNTWEKKKCYNIARHSVRTKSCMEPQISVSHWCPDLAYLFMPAVKQNQ